VDISLRLLLIERVVAIRYEPATSPRIVAMGEERGMSSNHVQSSMLELESRSSNAREPQAKRSRLPPLVTLLASPRFIAALLAAFVQALITSSFDTTLPLFAADTYNFDSTGAGLLFLALIIPSFVSPIVGKLADKYGTRWIMASGFLICCPFLVLCRVPDSDGVGNIVVLCILLVFVGLGLATAAVPVMAEFMLCVKEKEKNKPGIFGKKGAVAQAVGLIFVLTVVSTNNK